MGMRKFWSVALPFGKVACVVKGKKLVKEHSKKRSKE
jgi:hypothetical protein